MTRLTAFSLRYPKIVLAITLLITVGLGTGLLRLKNDLGFRAYLGANHPMITRMDEFIERFGGGYPVIVAWSCDQTTLCESVFDEASLVMDEAVSSVIALHPSVRRVESPATSNLLFPTPDGFDIRHFIENNARPPDIDELARRATIDPLWLGNLVSSDAAVGAIFVELVSTDSDLNLAFLDYLTEQLTPYEEQGFRYHLVGIPIELAITERDLRLDSARLTPAMIVLISAVIFFLFRSWNVVIATLATVGVATLWAFGIRGWLDWPQTPFSQVLAPVILVIAVCDSVHFISRFAALRISTTDRSDVDGALLDTSQQIGRACVMTSLTTVGGFLSFATSGLESFLRFGVIASIGVIAALFLTFSLLPIVLRAAKSPIRSWAGSVALDQSLQAIVHATDRRRSLVLLFAAVLAFVSWLGFSQIRVDVDRYGLYGEERNVVRWARFVEQHLRRPDTLEIDIQLPDETTLELPESLHALDALAKYLSSEEGLGRTRSALDPLRWANRLLHDDDPAYERIAETPEGNAELFLLLALQGGDTLDRWITLDQTHVRISTEAEIVTQERRVEILSNIDRYIDEELPADWNYSLTGPMALSGYQLGEIQRTQLRSFATAGVVVFVLLAFFFRSVYWALLGMLPTLLPVLLVLGAMGFWGIPLDVANAMIAAIMIGIGVDDVVHLLTQYRLLRHRGVGPREAIQQATLHVGRAVVTTSIALTLGWFTLTVSTWQSLARFGLLSGLAILAALVSCLVFLPALIGVADRRSEEKST